MKLIIEGDKSTIEALTILLKHDLDMPKWKAVLPNLIWKLEE